MLSTTALVVTLLILLLVGIASIWNGWRGVRLTPEYAGGIVAGMGIGLVICPFLVMNLGVELSQLLWPGVFVFYSGAGLALYAQSRAARGKLLKL